MYVIAEAGVNHNGKRDLAHQLIEAAAKAGAQAVKFQTFKTASLTTHSTPLAPYQSKQIEHSSQYAMLEKLELGFEDFKALKTHAENLNLAFLSTPFDMESAKLLLDLGVETFKIGSGDIDNLPLLLLLAQENRKIILSSGMSYLSDIEMALGAISFGLLSRSKPSLTAFQEAYGEIDLNPFVTLLHCTSDYPAPLKTLNLRAITTLRHSFGLKTGLSDHSQGYEAALLVLALGADMLEKHLTLDTTQEGPDHAASLNPQEFTQLVDKIKDAQLALGDGLKRPLGEEKNTKRVARKRVVAAQDLKPNTRLTPAHITLKRAETGAQAQDYFTLIGTKTTKAYAFNEGVTL
jgi:sialic acid synthase SpsE